MRTVELKKDKRNVDDDEMNDDDCFCDDMMMLNGVGIWYRCVCVQ